MHQQMSAALSAEDKHSSLEKSLPTPPSDSSPPSYTANGEAITNDILSDITAAFSNLNLSSSAKPTSDQCIAHLKLLEAFHQLREDVATQDDLFGIKDEFANKYVDAKRAEILSKIREKRWAVYVAKAAKRFERWWEKYIEPGAQKLIQLSMPVVFYPNGETLTFTRDNLPPLDVLMVWHAYQLNPRDFLEDSMRSGKLRFWRTGFPWPAVNACIDNESFGFSASDIAIRTFEFSTDSRWNSLDDPPFVGIQCARSSQIHSFPWTTWDDEYMWATAWQTQDILVGETLAHGFADQNFSVVCNCGATYDHDLLKMQKLRRDLEDLKSRDVPMPGTILDTYGSPETGSNRDRVKQAFPNRLILGPRRSKTSLYEDLQRLTIAPSGKSASINHVRSEFERRISDRSYLRGTLGILRSVPQLEEKIAVRRMMSRYWSNSSPFSLDLVGAVIRQGTFIKKMHSIDWLHSPSCTSTMARLLTKYARYFRILGENPNNVAVPTLDVDLAWHTHQLSPPAYYVYSKAATTKFIDHDDKIEETKLSTAFEWTSKTYQRLYNELYSECTCWYCESIRESHTSTLSTLFKSASKTPNAIDAQLDFLCRTHSASDPKRTPHISAHSAIRANTDRESAHTRLIVHQQKLERDYRKAVQRAQKRGRNPPARDQYMFAYAYGVPMYLPYYAPYMGDPCTGGMYPANPGCANLQSGAVGNCCQGACGGGVGAGSCAGNGAGGCAGGSAGGCGGGGGGGGGGCGGGGGGGGCGGGGS